jgi:large subunit ribosomal protein LP0
MSKGESQKKVEYFEKVRRLFREYGKIFIVNVDNVASTQMHQIRSSLRGKAIILMGKNTMVRKAMKEVIAENPKLEAIVPSIHGNVGLVFTNDDLKTVRDIMIANRVQSAAKIGLVAQCDIHVPAGNTGIDPNKTSFFQALGISTKVVKGAIEIASDVLLIKTGKKVGPSEAALLNMLNLVPFSFGLSVLEVYDDGSVFPPSMLDITDDVLSKHLQAAIKNIASLSLAAKFPTIAAAPHMMANAYKNVLSVGLACEEFTFEAVEKLKEAAKNAPAASSAPAAAPAAAKATKAAAPAKVETEEEEEMGMGLFD